MCEVHGTNKRRRGGGWRDVWVGSGSVVYAIRMEGGKKLLKRA